ncbi:MAG: tyrosine-type recombinase/integrase, partial [Deltaproteobacteria bacterium]|nr:tyrosine-type recombinase/integrase [Deltaproteobacteria bacterium]
YVTQRRNLGFRLQIDREQLLHFAKYVSDTGHQTPLTTELALRWVRLPKHASPSYQIRRLATIRSFAKYLAVYEPKTEIPPRTILRVPYYRPQPYIYSQQEIENLLRACTQLTPPQGLRPQTYRTLFGLLMATGLRVSEALKLNRSDVDLDQGLLTVRDTKFRKSRLVPVHDSTRQALRRYADLRNRCYPFQTISETFFLSNRGSALPYSTVSAVFRQLRRRLGWEQKNGKRPPRIHDLRHTFACWRILRWYEQGVNVDQFIPLLSTYLGHVKVSDTYWYLTGIPELFAITVKRFEHYAQSKKGVKS